MACPVFYEYITFYFPHSKAVRIYFSKPSIFFLTFAVSFAIIYSMDDRIKQSQNTFIGANSTYPVVQTLPVDSPRLIPLTQGKFAIVDAEDYEYLMQWKWCATIDDCGNPRAQTNRRVLGTKGDVKYKNIAMSRIIMEPELVDSDNGMVVDHYNFDTLDNRRCNLRVCTIRENNQNRKSTDWE